MPRKPLDDPNPTASELAALAAYREATGKLAEAWCEWLTQPWQFLSEDMFDVMGELVEIDGYIVDEKKAGMKQVQRREADDGTMHDSEQACREYEAAAAESARVTKYLDAVGVSGRSRSRIAKDVIAFLAFERTGQAPQSAPSE